MLRPLALLLAVTTCAMVSARGASAKPNIVLIISDDQAWTDYGFMDHPAIETPQIDALARSGALFTRGYVPTALCRPSLMTLATGLYAHQHKTSGNDPMEKDGAARGSAGYNALRERLIAHVDRHATLAELLAKDGYVSHQSGKWWEGSFRRGGFTEGMTRGFPERGGRHGDDGLAIGREGMTPVFDFIDRAVAAQKPFFIWYAPFMPHTPHTPPDRLFEKYRATVESDRVAKYYAMCEWFDETCGALVRKIADAGLTEDTLFVFVGDNGWIQNPGDPGYLPRSKRSPYDAGTRQPIILSWPGTIPPRRDDETLVSSLDLFPTIVAAAGAATPENRPGLNLLPLVRDGEPLGRDTIFGESFAHDIADIDGPEASLLHRWVIRGRFKLMVDYDNPSDPESKAADPAFGSGPRLYDLREDPHENRNLADDPSHAETLRELHAALDAWVAGQDA